MFKYMVYDKLNTILNKSWNIMHTLLLYYLKCYETMDEVS